MQEKNIAKIPGKSWLLDNAGVYHQFYANDKNHPRIEEVFYFEKY